MVPFQPSPRHILASPLATLAAAVLTVMFAALLALSLAA